MWNMKDRDSLSVLISLLIQAEYIFPLQGRKFMLRKVKTIPLDPNMSNVSFPSFFFFLFFFLIVTLSD